MRSLRNLTTMTRFASSRLVGAAGVAAIAALAACEDASAPTAPTVSPATPSASVVARGPNVICTKCGVSDDILAVRLTVTGPQIIKVKPDGSGLVVLTNGYSPAWSPSKSKIAFVREVGNGEIFTMNADGTGIVQITNSPTTKEVDPTWSPDGQYIAYASNKNQYGAPYTTLDVWTMKADGTAPVKLTPAASSDELRPSWSKDFTKIAYMQATYPWSYYHVWVMELDPATRQPIVASQITPWTLTENAMNPAFSPDGSKIAFEYKNGGCGISTINLNGTNMQSITVGGGFKCTQPTWSPSGAKLAFYSPNLWNGAIVTVNTDGTGFQQVTSGKMVDYAPAWSR